MPGSAGIWEVPRPSLPVSLWGCWGTGCSSSKAPSSLKVWPTALQSRCLCVFHVVLRVAETVRTREHGVWRAEGNGV